MPLIPANLLVPLMGESSALTVERSAGVTTNDYGEVVPDAAALRSVNMVVHQATRKQIERAGLDFGHDWRAFYANEELRTANPGPPDVVQYNGERWTLFEVADYGTMGGMWIALGRLVE